MFIYEIYDRDDDPGSGPHGILSHERQYDQKALGAMRRKLKRSKKARQIRAWQFAEFLTQRMGFKKVEPTDIWVG